MTVGTAGYGDMLPILLGVLAPGVVLGLGFALAARLGGVRAEGLPRAAVGLFLLSLVLFALAAEDAWLLREVRAFLAWPVAAWVAGASVGVMAAATLRWPRPTA